MDLQTLEKGNELLAKYRLCETMLEYMSDPDAVTGQKYKEQCGEFFKVFHDEMLVFTHELMTKCGEEFVGLHCECHTESETPIVPDGPMFIVGSKVKVIGGVWSDLIGKTGEIVAVYESRNTISVLFDFDGVPYEFNPNEIEPYTESENPEGNGARDTDPTEGE